LGQSDDGFGHGHAARLKGGTVMSIQGNYLGMSLSIDDLDQENVAYFKHCAAHDFHLQKCDDCNLLRYPPTTGCPWCASPRATWTAVEGKGEVHSYEEVHHAIQPAFKAHTPYMVLLVDLDTQKGQPSEYEALRVAGNLTTPDGILAPPELVRSLGIGTRVRMVFSDVGDGLSLPQWTIDNEAKQPDKPWRYAQE
jgi:uncharacterized OB-fold protein